MAKDVCAGRAPALSVWLEDTDGPGMVVGSTVAFGDTAAAPCVGLRVGVRAHNR